MNTRPRVLPVGICGVGATMPCEGADEGRMASLMAAEDREGGGAPMEGKLDSEGSCASCDGVSCCSSCSWLAAHCSSSWL